MADTLDVLTLEEGKHAISMSVTNNEHDAKLATFITGVSRRLDELVGPIVQRTVTEYHNGGQAVIWPHQTPVSSVTTLKESDGTTTTVLTADVWGAATAANGYLLEQSTSYPHDSRIRRRASGAAQAFLDGPSTVELVYVAGRAASTAAVDARYKFAASEILVRAWKPQAAAWSQTPDFLTNVDAEVTTASRNPHLMRVLQDWLGDELKPPAAA